jgi:hypothetical protein
MKNESQIRERLMEVKESWLKYYDQDFKEDKDPYMDLTTEEIMSATQIESEITTLEWILEMEYSPKYTE